MQRECILVGELVVWNVHFQDIMPFYKIRRYVAREGRRLGCDADPAPDHNEHLMIIFHDLLLWDDRICLQQSYTRRRRLLRGLLPPIPGHAERSDQVI